MHALSLGRCRSPVRPLLLFGRITLRAQAARRVDSGGGCAAQWARTVLLAKDTPTASDARLLELAFELRLSSLESGGHPQETGPASPQTPEHVGPSAAALISVRDRPSESSAAAIARVLRRAKPSRPESIRACCRSGRCDGIGTKRTSNGLAALPRGRRPSDSHHLWAAG